MKARIWDLDGAFAGMMLESDAPVARLDVARLDPPWGYLGQPPETSLFDRYYFARVEIRVWFAGRWRTCWRWVSPDLKTIFDKHLAALAVRRTPNSRG
jgi:hypothetical protein